MRKRNHATTEFAALQKKAMDWILFVLALMIAFLASFVICVSLCSLIE